MKFKTNDVFWKLQRQSTIQREMASIILLSKNDLSDFHRTRAEGYMELAHDIAVAAWVEFYILNPKVPRLETYIADPLSKKVEVRK